MQGICLATRSGRYIQDDVGTDDSEVICLSSAQWLKGINQKDSGIQPTDSNQGGQGLIGDGGSHQGHNGSFDECLRFVAHGDYWEFRLHDRLPSFQGL